MGTIIELSNLYKKLGDKQVLSDLSLNIHDGETFVILGQSGVGKSVILKHIVGLMQPDSGEIYIDGENMIRADEKRWAQKREKIGMLFQSGALFDSLTVGQNLLFALDHVESDLTEDEKVEKIGETLTRVGLPGIEDIMPADLSGGMMKRVALARAIVTDPEIVLFDEPTTGLDPITTAAINELMVEIKKEMNTTFVVVTHNIASASFIADRVAMIYGGQIVFQGGAKELQKSENPYLNQFVLGKSEGPIQVDYKDALSNIKSRLGKG